MDEWSKDHPQKSLRDSIEQAKPSLAGQVAQDFEAAAPHRDFTVEELQQRGDGYDGGSSEYENEGT